MLKKTGKAQKTLGNNLKQDLNRLEKAGEIPGEIEEEKLLEKKLE